MQGRELADEIQVKADVERSLIGRGGRNNVYSATLARAI